MVLKKVFITGALVFVVAVFVAMVTLGVAGNKATTKPLIVSGVSQWGALARQLVGPDARVVSLITDPNADPHQHEATVADAANVADADVVLLNGAGYDTWLSQLVANRSGSVATINVASLMHVAAGQNPHLFYDPRAAIRFVQTLTSTLEHRSGYPHIGVRSTQLLGQLNALQRSALTIRQSCAGVAVAATEDVTTYLLNDMGLKIVTPEGLRLAVGNGVDPSVSDLAQALAQMDQHPAFLIDNTQTATPLTNEIVAKARSAQVPVIKVTETMTGTNYVTWINGVVHSIVQTLKKEGCIK
jgi:zinc/manganese transport system substrate-binding protein